MTYDEWEATVPVEIRAEPCWSTQAYRLGCYIAAVVDLDTEPLLDDPRYVRVLAQLCDAAASISANIAEAYSRFSPAARIQFYEYALGFAGEAKTRYFNLQRKLDPALLPARLATLGSIARLTLATIRSERRNAPRRNNRKPESD